MRHLTVEQVTDVVAANLLIQIFNLTFVPVFITMYGGTMQLVYFVLPITTCISAFLITWLLWNHEYGVEAQEALEFQSKIKEDILNSLNQEKAKSLALESDFDYTDHDNWGNPDYFKYIEN